MFTAAQLDIQSVNSASNRQFFTKVSNTDDKIEKPKDQKESGIFGEGLDHVFNFFSKAKDALFSEKPKEDQSNETTSAVISAVVSTLNITGKPSEDNISSDDQDKK